MEKSPAYRPLSFDPQPRRCGVHCETLALGARGGERPERLAAERLGVNPWTVLNWEKDHSEPPIEFMPAIIRFLGYDPFPEPQNIPERLLVKRRAMGWSIKEATRQLGVDEETWGAWEQGGVILYRNYQFLAARLLGLAEGEVDQDMGVRWNWLHK